MKKISLKFITVVAFVFTLFAFLAPHKAEAWEWSFIRGQDWETIRKNAKFEPSGIREGKLYSCENLLVISVDGKKAADRGLHFKGKDGTITKRRLIDEKKPEGFMLYKNGVVGPLKDKLGTLVALSFCEIVVWRDIEWYRPNANTRYFKVQGTIELDQRDPGFRLVGGALLEEKNFKSVASADQMMDIYTGVATSVIKNAVDTRRKAGNFGNNNELLATAVAGDWAGFAVLLGAASGLAPIWALPLEFANDFQDNLQKAYMSYAIAYALGKEPDLSGDDFKNDLYILFDDGTLEETIDKIARAAGWTGNTVELIKAGKIVEKIGRTKFAQSVLKIQKAKIIAKFTVKGASKAAAAISAAAPWVGGAMSGAQATIFGLKALNYYRAK